MAIFTLKTQYPETVGSRLIQAKISFSFKGKGTFTMIGEGGVETAIHLILGRFSDGMEKTPDKE